MTIVSPPDSPPMPQRPVSNTSSTVPSPAPPSAGTMSPASPSSTANAPRAPQPTAATTDRSLRPHHSPPHSDHEDDEDADPATRQPAAKRRRRRGAFTTNTDADTTSATVAVAPVRDLVRALPPSSTPAVATAEDDDAPFDMRRAVRAQLDLPLRPPVFLPGLSLHPGAEFVGTQCSGQVNYRVEITLKDIDWEAGRLAGFLRIHELTNTPMITTFWDGEILDGVRHSFVTNQWGANTQTDLDHWSRFQGFDRIAPSFNTANERYDYKSQRLVYMRWKERFLVPDHKAQIDGASFVGFYYICMDREKQHISGFYCHKNSEAFQQLEVQYVPRRCSATFAFR
ncbi:GID complex subunit 4, VID24 [Allomyces arbusculus]|nr:GID complex subunit 4, VID24 [Allomyces arbusculus]